MGSEEVLTRMTSKGSLRAKSPTWGVPGVEKRQLLWGGVWRESWGTPKEAQHVVEGNSGVERSTRKGARIGGPKLEGITDKHGWAQRRVPLENSTILQEVR